MNSERIFQRNSSGSEVVDIAGNHHRPACQCCGGDHQVGAAVANVLAQTPPDPRFFCAKGEDAVREQPHSPVDPGPKICSERGVLALLRTDATFNLTKGDNAEEQLAFCLAAQPGCDLWRAVGTADRRDHVGVEQIYQNATSRGRAVRRLTSSPGKVSKCSAKLSRCSAASATKRWYC